MNVAVRNAHEKYLKKTVATKILTAFFAIILALSNFIFNSNIYLQIKGCAMGTVCVPSYPNIFMAYSEQKFI